MDGRCRNRRKRLSIVTCGTPTNTLLAKGTIIYTQCTMLGPAYSGASDKGDRDDLSTKDTCCGTMLIL